MEKYLAIAAAIEPFNTRKADIGSSLREVRHFRARHGMLDPADAVDEDERTYAAFQRAVRLFREALTEGMTTAAREAVAEMSGLARRERDDWRRTDYLTRVIACFAELDDIDAVRRHLRMIDPDDRHEAIKPLTLLRLGMRAEGVRRIRAELRRRLAEACDPSDMNAHFAVNHFTRALRSLVECGASDEARRWLERAARDRGKWALPETGAFTAGATMSLAEAAMELGDRMLARQLATEGAEQSRREPRSAM